MEKLKQGKMDQKAFWITFGVVCLIFVLMAVNLSVGDPLGDVGRGAVGILAFVIYMVACAMRLRESDERGNEERYDMCKAFEDMRQEGFDEGIEKGICALIQTCMELGISDDIIVEKCAEKYEMTKETVGIYMEECCA